MYDHNLLEKLFDYMIWSRSCSIIICSKILSPQSFYGVLVLFLQVEGSGRLALVCCPSPFFSTFSGPATEGTPSATPQDSPPHGGGACCPELFGYLLPLVLEKIVAASASHAVTEGVGDRRAELFRRLRRAPWPICIVPY